MNLTLRLAARVYALILRLYPPAFRQELGAEMQDVFFQAAADAGRRGLFCLLAFFWRELRDLPASLVEVLHIQWQGGFIMKVPDYSRWFGDPVSPPNVITPRSWKEVLFGLGFFFILILMTVSEIWHRYSENPVTNQLLVVKIISIIGLVSILGFLIFGIIRKFPDWSLPYAGFIVSILSALVLLAMNRSQPTVLIAILFFISPVVAILVSRTVKPIRPLWQTIQADPTRFGFLYMGLMALAYMLVLDDSPYEEYGFIICLLISILFAVFYLRSTRLWQRIALPPLAFLAAWIFCAFYSYAVTDRPLVLHWDRGVGVLLWIGFLILLWFLLPALWIFLRWVKWIPPDEA